jgi:capsular polysaccharide transport system permease protein
MESHVQDDTKLGSKPKFRFAWPTKGGALAEVRRSGLAPAGGHLPGVIGGYLPDARTGGRRLSLSGTFGLLLSFIFFVVVPTALAGIYYGAIASNVYLSEAKFAIRGATEKLPTGGASAAGSLPGMPAGLSSMSNSQDAYVVADYIRSTPLVEKLDRDSNLHMLFARNEVDFLSRLRTGSSVEALRRYWESMVYPSVDAISGILTLRVEAYSPEDALTISRAVLAESEALVNEMSQRRLTDAVKNASDEVTRAEQRLQAARLAIQAFRNSSGQIDPVRQSEGTLNLLALLRSEQAKFENEVATSRRTLNDDSPSLQVLNARLKALTEQIKVIERTVASESAGDQTASRALFQYEGLEVERQFAERLYLISQAGLERARMNAARQQLYFVTFVEPSLAEKPAYPLRLRNVMIVLMCAASLWSILALLVATIKDHLV